MNTAESQNEPNNLSAFRKPKRWIFVGLFGVLTVGGLGILWASTQRATARIIKANVVNRFPHDPRAFTQGLLVSDGQLYESTGQYGSSSLRRVELESGRVLQSVSVSREIFAEGIADREGAIVMLTWKNRRAYTFDRRTFQHQETFRYSGEGWGITYDGEHFLMSDGSSRIRFMDPKTFKEVRRITVLDGRRRIEELNELEFINGEIWANVWYSDMVARISPSDGRLIGWIDLSNLWPVRQRPSREHVLNGIAYDRQSGRIFVTGKNWPNLFEIQVPGL